MAPFVNPFAGRIEVLGRTAFAVVYTEHGNRKSVLKGLSVWIDGVEYDRPPMATDGTIEREAAIYEVLGDHPQITRSFGLELVNPASKAYALRLERAPIGCLREFIMECPSEAIPALATRLRMAADFAEGVSFLHSKRILWADLSVRNTLLFDNYQIKLSDFGGALLPGTYDDAIQLYETRYEPPVKVEDYDDIPMMAREIFALGTALYEIIEWKVPYGISTDDEEVVDPCKRRGELPVLSKDNPAKNIIMRCWTQYASVSESWEEYTLSQDVHQSLQQLTCCI